jgi:hypothetical protein
MAEAARKIVDFPQSEFVTIKPNPAFKARIRRMNLRELEKMRAAQAIGKQVPYGLLYCIQRNLEDRCRRGQECREFCMCGNGYEGGGGHSAM